MKQLILIEIESDGIYCSSSCPRKLADGLCFQFATKLEPNGNFFIRCNQCLERATFTDELFSKIKVEETECEE